MTVIDLSETQEEQAPEPIGPGQQLREARERRKLSREDVAQNLRLDLKKIVALEGDDFAALPQPAFVAGYLRGYARLVGLDGEALVEDYKRLSGVRLTPAQLVSAPVKSQPRSGDRPVRWVSYLIVAALAVLVIVWFESRQGTVEPPPQAPELLGEALAPPAVLEPAAPEAAPLGMEPAAAEQAPAVPAEPVPVAQPAVVEPAPVAQPEVVEPAPPVQQVAPGAPAQLLVRYSKDSWTEISDATGKRIYFNLGRAGETHRLQGTPPFKVLLGYARGVDIEYNGRPFDYSAFISKEMARFEVGGPAAD